MPQLLDGESVDQPCGSNGIIHLMQVSERVAGANTTNMYDLEGHRLTD